MSIFKRLSWWLDSVRQGYWLVYWPHFGGWVMVPTPSYYHRHTTPWDSFEAEQLAEEWHNQ